MSYLSGIENGVYLDLVQDMGVEDSMPTCMAIMIANDRLVRAPAASRIPSHSASHSCSSSHHSSRHASDFFMGNVLWLSVLRASDVCGFATCEQLSEWTC